MKPDLSKFFVPYKDPESCVTSYILSKRLAPVQLGFYFVNTGFTKNNRYLWFYCAFPPAGNVYFGRTLAVIDFEKMTINHFPETAFSEASPLVSDETGGVYWASEKCLCYRSPDPEDTHEIIAFYPEDLFGERKFGHFATHLTLSPNKKELFFDAHSGNQFFAGTVNLETKKFEVWKKFERKYNHGQICPIDENLALLAQENMIDMYTGVKTKYDNRLWILKRDGTFKPIFKENTRVTHEWWDADGIHVYALNQMEQMDGPAIIKVDIKTDKVQNIWHGQYWHANDFDHGKWLVADKHHLTDFYRGCPSRVSFINLEKNKEQIIISNNPEFQTPGGLYHIDPHPRFSPDGTMITHTTTVLGRVDVAVTFTEDLLKMM
jgi:hypothetical protein